MARPTRRRQRIPKLLLRFENYPKELTNKHGVEFRYHNLAYTPYYRGRWVGWDQAVLLGVDPGWLWAPVRCLIRHAERLYECDDCRRPIYRGELYAAGQTRSPTPRYCIDCVVHTPLPEQSGMVNPP